MVRTYGRFRRLGEAARFLEVYSGFPQPPRPAFCTTTISESVQAGPGHSSCLSLYHMGLRQVWHALL